jgi:hypothetical protein
MQGVLWLQRLQCAPVEGWNMSGGWNMSTVGWMKPTMRRFCPFQQAHAFHDTTDTTDTPATIAVYARTDAHTPMYINYCYFRTCRTGHQLRELDWRTRVQRPMASLHGLTSDTC